MNRKNHLTVCDNISLLNFVSWTLHYNDLFIFYNMSILGENRHFDTLESVSLKTIYMYRLTMN